MHFSSILTIGPSFKVNAQTTATLDVDLNLKVGLSYNVNNAQLFFPPSSELQSGGDFAPGDTRAFNETSIQTANDRLPAALQLWPSLSVPPWHPPVQLPRI